VAHRRASALRARGPDALYGLAVEMEVKPTPLFLLGHWRRTTHLQNVLGKDPNHTVLTL
jgi:hypothetical protein